MNNFIFENATKAIFGQGCVKEYLACLSSHYGENVLFAYGGGSIKKNGVYGQVMEALERAGKNVTEFSGIMTNPTYEKVMEGARLARENHVNLILGAGGGSVMDCCKAVSMAAVYEGDVWEDFWDRPGIVEFEPLPLGVVVTAAGSGSEMNGCAAITNEGLKRKTGRDYPKCNPRFALMDPAYAYSVPIRQLASGGFEALSHLMEIYFSQPDEDNVSDDIAEVLMRGVIRDLRKALCNPRNYAARSNLMWQATMAKSRIIRLGKQTDFQCRQMGHQLGVYANCGHGEGMAVLQPAYYRHIYRAGCFKFQRFAVNVWGVSRKGKSADELARAGVEALADFIGEIGLAATLRELGIDKRVDLKDIADSCNVTPGGYRRLTREEILEIFQEVW